MPIFRNIRNGYLLLAVSAVATLSISACGGSSSPNAGGAGVSASTGVGRQIVPVKSNPIKNTSTAQTLKITSFLVENNVDPATKKIAPDHLEIAMKNTGAAALSGFEVYYTFTDKVTKTSESYYTKLPAKFSLPAGGTKTINFDNSGKPNHFPVNKFDIYHTSKNALAVTVEVSASGAAPQTSTASKAAGGAEGAN